MIKAGLMCIPGLNFFSPKMKTKAESTVFFIDNMSAEKEYEIVNRKASKKTKEVVGRVAGDAILLCGARLFRERPLRIVDLTYDEQDEKMFGLFVCLVTLPPVYNFLLNFGERSQDIGDCRITSRLSAVLGLLARGEEANVNDLLAEPEARRYGEMYSELLKAVHNELCARYSFEEDVWNSSGEEVRFRLLYQEYSPVVEMFQGKGILGHPQPQSTYFEKIVLSSKDASSVKDAFETFMRMERCEMAKMPAVLTLVMQGRSRVEVRDEDISIDDASFFLSAFITETETASYCHVKNDGEWFEYGRNGLERMSGMEDVHGSASILFYVCRE